MSAKNFFISPEDMRLHLAMKEEFLLEQYQDDFLWPESLPRSSSFNAAFSTHTDICFRHGREMRASFRPVFRKHTPETLRGYEWQRKYGKRFRIAAVPPQIT